MSYEMRKRVPKSEVKVAVPADHENIYKSPLTCFVEQEIVGRVFEELLWDNDVTLPDPAREGCEDEARIYGGTYDQVCADVESKVREWLEKILPDADIAALVFAPCDLKTC